MSIQEIIIATLQHEGLTQKGLASNIDVSSSTLNNWLKLGRDIPSQYIIPICEFLKITPQYLLSGQDTEKKLVSGLTEDEQKILNYYAQLTEEQKDYIKGEMARLNMTNKRDTEFSAEKAT